MKGLKWLHKAHNYMKMADCLCEASDGRDICESSEPRRRPWQSDNLLEGLISVLHYPQFGELTAWRNIIA